MGGRKTKADFPDWGPVHRILFKNGILGIENVGGTSQRSPAVAAPSRCFPGIGSAATVASYGLLPSSTRRAPIGSTRGEVSDASEEFEEAKSYEAPNHRGYCSLRLFGLDAGGPKQFTVGLSHFLPGGGAGPDASPTEKVYYVLAGELTLIAGGKETVLRANDSCFIGPDESREIINRGNDVVTMLVAVSTPQK